MKHSKIALLPIPLARATRLAQESQQVDAVASSVVVTALSITDEEKEKRLNLASSSAPTSPSKVGQSIGGKGCVNSRSKGARAPDPANLTPNIEGIYDVMNISGEIV